ncbi:MAG: hypothetical protein QOI79_691 [Mycobacterium sp.]|jgi:hypothetical protein|nr:hypothetical protein [Mycobacterium sp.]MDT5201140.1 hypothetical protein [Mycobacterium sp.]
MNNNKPVVLVVGAIAALFAASLVLRIVVLSQSGLPGGWILYLGLPIGGIGALALLLLRLGVLNVGERSNATIQHWQHQSAAQGPSLPAPPSAASTSQRLQELETLRLSGTISDAEYATERARIIAGV